MNSYEKCKNDNLSKLPMDSYKKRDDIAITREQVKLLPKERKRTVNCFDFINRVSFKNRIVNCFDSTNRVSFNIPSNLMMNKTKKTKNRTAGIIPVIGGYAGGVRVQINQIRANPLPEAIDYGGDMHYCIIKITRIYLYKSTSGIVDVTQTITKALISPMIG